MTKDVKSLRVAAMIHSVIGVVLIHGDMRTRYEGAYHNNNKSSDSLSLKFMERGEKGRRRFPSQLKHARAGTKNRDMSMRMKMVPGMLRDKNTQDPI